MTTYRIPNNGQISQPNKGDISGNLSQSLNLDVRTNPGRFRVSPRLIVITKDNDASLTGFGLPIVFLLAEHSSGSRVFMITAIGTDTTNGTGRVFMNTGINFSAFVNLAGGYATNQPTTIQLSKSDAVLWNGNIMVSHYTGNASNISRLGIVSAAWTANWYTVTVAGSFGTADSLANMGVGFNGNLYIAQAGATPAYGNVTYVGVTGNAVESGNGTLDFGLRYTTIWIRSTSNRIWVGMMEWLGSNTTAGNDGCIAEWDGTGSAANKIHHINAPCALSACVYKDVLYIIDAWGVLKKFSGYDFQEVARLPVANTNYEMPGIRLALRNDRWIHQRGMEVVGGKIKVLVNNLVSSGVYVSEMPSGVWSFDPENPSQGFIHEYAPCAASTDFGQQAVEGVGALGELKISNTGNLFAGVSYYTDDATTNRKAVFYDDVATNATKRGSFTTPFLPSDQIQDTWQRANYRLSALPSGDKVIGKYRVAKDSNFPFIASATWTSTTTFTSTSANFANVVAGHEVESVMGGSASTTAHVSSISNVAGTYTVTIDEAIGQASGTFKIKVDNFKKMGTISATSETEGDLPMGDMGTKVQVKTEVRATGNLEIEDVTVIGQKHKLLT